MTQGIGLAELSAQRLLRGAAVGIGRWWRGWTGGLIRAEARNHPPDACVVKSGVTGDMSDKVSVESIALARSPAMFAESIPHEITADILVSRLLVAGNDHHVLFVLGVSGEPVPEFLFRRNFYPL